MKATSVLLSASKSVKDSLMVKHSGFLSSIRDWVATDPGRTQSGSLTMNRHPQDSSVSVLRIDNPEKRGSISANMMLQLAMHVDNLELEDEDSLPTGIIIASTGDFFSSGLDLNLAKGLINTPEMGASMCSFMTDALNRIRSSNAISVCVISAPAIGGGMELVTTTDFRVMRTDAPVTKDDDEGELRPTVWPAPFIQSVHARIGAAPGWGGARRLVSIVGRQHALNMLGTSAKIYPEHAVDIGLVDSLYVADEGEDCVEVGYQYLSPFLKQRYSGSVKAMKEICHAADTQSMEGGIEAEKAVFQRRWFGRDNRDALGLVE